jgi:hypothetical protein
VISLATALDAARYGDRELSARILPEWRCPDGVQGDVDGPGRRYAESMHESIRTFWAIVFATLGIQFLVLVACGGPESAPGGCATLTDAVCGVG